jgi:hypothetical protein
MEPRNTGTGTTATDQNAVAQPPTPHTAGNPAATQAGNRGTTQETATFSPPGNQGYQPGGPNNSDGR